MKKRFFYLLPLLALLAVACDKGDPLANQPPETGISVSSINLTGPDRLTSEVALHWYGEDADGIVTGFEISFDNNNWNYVNQQDSTFSFDISGIDTLDINFWVRSVDNDEMRDPSPAYLKVPVKNSPPTVKFDTVNVVNDTIYSVFSTLWTVDDPDGFETLDSIFVRINSGAWMPLPSDITIITVVPTDPSATGAVTASVYRDLNPTLVPGLLDGLLLEGNNRVYLKARDNAGSESTTDSTNVFYARRKTSDLLVIDSHTGSGPTPEEIYYPLLTTVYGGFDYINLERNSGENIPSLWDPTFGFLMNLYDKVFWYSDASLLGVELYLEAGSGVISEYINQGGKILISTVFPTTFDNTSTILQFAPFDSLSTSVGQARMPLDSLVVPMMPGYDTLVPSAFLIGCDPMYPSDNAEIVMKGNFFKTGGWVGPDVACVSTEVAPGQISQVFVSLELHRLNGNPAALETFFQQVLLNDFNW
jgi:hypothetical protein